MPPSHHFDDIVCYQEQFLNYGTAQFYEFQGRVPWTYPATMAVVYHLFYLAPSSLNIIFIYFGLAALIWVSLAGAFLGALVGKGLSTGKAALLVATVLITSYPLWQMIEFANLELIIVLFVGLGVIAYLRNRLWWAAALFALAASLKIFPIIYLGLFFSRKEYRKLLFGIVVAVTAFLLGHWIAGPDLRTALLGTSSAIERYKQLYIMRVLPGEIGFDHSLFTIVKQIYVLALAHGYRVSGGVAYLYKVYVPVVLVGAGYPFFTTIRRLPRLNRVFAITTCALLIPPVSYDYRLPHLYFPWAFLVLYLLDNENAEQRRMAWYLVPLSILFAAESFLRYSITLPIGNFTLGYGGQIKAIALLVLFWVAVRIPLAVKDGTPTELAPSS